MDGKRLPIGIDDFAEIVRKDFYYVDKTGMIKDLLDNWGKVNLFTRPRRFGKSLNMSMLQRFFETGTDKSLFDGLAIAKESRMCEEYQGQYPVVSVSLKTVEGNNYEMARANLCTVIGNEASRFQFLLDDDRLSEVDKNSYLQLIGNGAVGEDKYLMSDSVLAGSLKTLTDLLYKYYGKQVILLIDEYDVPLAKANEAGYYEEMIEKIRGMFNASLKSNNSLLFAAMTGCLRISRESIFTGLNNPKMYTLLDAECDEYFGFTDAEVREMLDAYGLLEYYDVTKEWYDGYRVANANVYNPWDVVNWCNQLLTSPNKTPKSYWANSSANEELKKFIRRMGNGVTKTQLERLVSGQTVQKKIEEQLTYDSMYDSIENMWSLLFATGYLTHDGNPSGNLVRLMIPNEEIRTIYRDFILKLFEEEVARDTESVSMFCRALKTGDAPEVERLFTGFMNNTISIRDTAVRKEFKESFYHGILLGMLIPVVGWSVDSNRESGEGYYDIAIEIEDEYIGIIIEVKYAENEGFDAACAEAMEQINRNNYTAMLKEDDMQKILKFGIACCRKRCMVVVQEER